MTRFLSFTFILLLSACATSPQKPIEPITKASEPSPIIEDSDAPKPSRPIPKATLEALLTAEFAALRNYPALTLNNYIEQAFKTRDPDIVARACTISQILKQPQSLALSRLWSEVSPKEPEPWYLLTLNSLQNKQFDLGLSALDQLLKIKPDADLEQLFLAVLPPTKEERQQLLTDLEKLSEKYPNNSNLLFSQALLKNQNGQNVEALTITRAAKINRPNNPQLTLLEAKILTELDRSTEAVTLLSNAVKAQPNNLLFRLNLARAYLKAKDYPKAQQEFQDLQLLSPNDNGIRLSLALVAYENQDNIVAERELTYLSNTDEYHDESSYYLGMLNERQKKYPEAVEAFQNIGPGNYFIPGMSSLARMLAQQEKWDDITQEMQSAQLVSPEQDASLFQLEAEIFREYKKNSYALQALNRGISKYPDNTALLLSRAILADSDDKLDDLERDLNHILQLEPENTLALNALGYAYAQRNTKLAQAEKLLIKANQLKPNDPAIMDSLGWLQYRKGDTKSALVNLRRAYAAFPDDEVAAHLGEVLWKVGNTKEALRIWQEALQRKPNSEHILKTKARLDVKSAQ